MSFLPPFSTPAVYYYSIAVVAINGIVLWLYARENAFDDVERFYFRNDRYRYGALKAAYYIVFVTFLLAARTLLLGLLKLASS